MDLKGNVLHRRLLTNGNEKRYHYSKISEFEGELKHFSQQCDTVYTMDGNFKILSAKYILDYGEYKYKDVNLLVNRDIMETDDFIVLDILFPLYSNKGIEQHCIIEKVLYDKKSGKTSFQLPLP